MAKYFKYPFATSGDRTAIPDAVQPSGSVSYAQGFGPDYELDLLTDPAAKPVPRDQSNELYYDITLALKQYQELGVPDFITTVDNGGTPFPYAINARVRYDAGGGYKTYQSLVNSNTALPSDITKWIVDDIPASGFVTPVQLQEQIYDSGTGTITSNVLTVNPTYAYAAYQQSGTLGRISVYLASGTNTTSAVLNVSGLGNILIVKVVAGGVVPLSGGELVAGGAYVFLTTSTAAFLINPVTPTYTYVSPTQLQEQLYTYSPGSISANVLTANPAAPYVAYESGTSLGRICIGVVSGTNSGPAILNVSGLGAITIEKFTTAGPAVLTGGELVGGNIYDFVVSNTVAYVLNPTQPTGTYITPAQLQQQVYTYASATGVANVFTATPATPYTAYQAGSTLGQITLLIASGTNSGPATLNVSGLGAIPFVKQTNAGFVALVGNELLSGCVYNIITSNSVAVVTNPTPSTPIFGWVRLNGTQVLGPNTTTKIAYDAVVHDTYGLWDGGATDFVIPLNGFYRVSVTASLVATGTHTYYLYVYSNGSLLATFDSSQFVTTNMNGSMVFDFTAGDLVAIFISNVSASNTTVEDAASSISGNFFQIEYVGPT